MASANYSRNLSQESASSWTNMDLGSGATRVRDSNIQINLPQDEVARPVSRPVTIALVGKSGHGKSTSGNSILGRDAFHSESSPDFTTTTVQEESEELRQREVTVIDTPDPNSMSGKLGSSLMRRCDVVMFVLRCGTRMTKEEWKSFKILKESLGHDVFSKRGIIILTHCDLFPLARVSMDISFLDSALLEEFNHRVGFLNNKEDNHLVQITQVDDVMTLVDQLVQELDKSERTTKKENNYLCCCFKRQQRYVL